jgi:hypothetical protein
MRRFSPQEVIGILSRLIARIGPLSCTIGGTIRFNVAGADGGSWCVSLDAAGGAWSSDDARPADTTLFVTADAFHALITNQPVSEHLRRGELILLGDRTKLARLGALIDQGGGVVAQRVRNNAHRSRDRKLKEVRG